jgi:N utilization substance protein B
MTHPRTRARELALQYLYMDDMLHGKDVGSFDGYLAGQTPPLDAPVADYARRLVESVLARRDELDGQIAAVALNWKVTRMAAVDRNILRLGLAELTAWPETPYKVVINEAVELARRYSSEEACAFVNGVLDRLRLRHRGPTDAAPSGAAGEGRNSAG